MDIYSIYDKKFKSTEKLIHFLVNAAGKNGNLLLNVGPMPNGKIQPEFVLAKEKRDLLN